MYYYWGFELNIASEIEFPELLPAQFEQADLVIKIGAIPNAIETAEPHQQAREEMISDNEYFLDIRDICKYYVFDGKEIIIEPYAGIKGRSIRIYLLATVMAMVVLQRGAIPLHASGIVKNDKLILFTGDSGAGKSTTLANLVAKGYRIFTDDICVLKTDAAEPHKVLGVASYPMLKLWDDALSKLDNDAYRDKNFRVNEDMDKYGYFFYDSFIKEPYPIDKIFIIKKSEEHGNVVVNRLMGVEAFQQLEKQAYRKYLIVDHQLRALHFRIMSALTQTCAIYEIIRPVNGTVNQLTEALEELF